MSHPVPVPAAAAQSPDIFWFIPTHGDGAYLGSETRQRPPEFAYFREVAQAVDRLGFKGVLLPTGQSCEDSWITAAGLATATERLKFLVALRPGITTPAFAARQAAALDRLSDGRLLLNVVVGGHPAELAADGIFLDHDARYAQADEFLSIWRDLVAGKTVDHTGKYYRVEHGRLDFPVVQQPHPPLWFGGSSEAGHEVAAEHTSVYLSWGEPPHILKDKLADVQARAARRGRKLKFGLRIHFIVRETEAEAWAAADRLISQVSDEQIESAQKRFKVEMDSVGQARMAALQPGDRNKLEIAPNLWAGIGLVRRGAGTALVGDPKSVAARIREYQEIGIETFIGSGYPHLEEAYRVAELLFPELGIDGRRRKVSDNIVNEFAVGSHLAERRRAAVS